ncbi:methyltransferase domain-containing protein [Sarocladium implicatum]|nr:methyltransferase domain-containing protein [Sarocladium implicatum]
MGSNTEDTGSFNNLVERYEARSGGHTRALARYFLQLPELQGITSGDATVLDNACGTGIVTSEILRLARNITTSTSTNPETLPHFHLTDISPNMISLAHSNLTNLNILSHATLSPSPSESLPLPSSSITHSITNCGILFFKNPQAGASEIFRTLSPTGTAIITTWRTFDFFSTVVFPSQLAIRPNDPPLPPPPKQPWHDPAHLEKVLREAGFTSVRVREKTVTYGAKSVEEMVAMLGEQLEFFVGERWTAEEKGGFREAVRRRVKTQAEARTLVDGEEGIGFPVHGLVAVCRK